KSLLVLPLASELFPLLAAGNNANPASIDERTLHLFSKYFSVYVLHSFISHTAYNDYGWFAILAVKLIEPGAGRGVGDHLFSHQAGIGIVPAAREAGYGVGSSVAYLRRRSVGVH